MWSRIHLIPLLQAEEDRDLVRRHWADKEREKEFLGSETKVYHSDRCVLVFLKPLLVFQVNGVKSIHFHINVRAELTI